MSAEPFRERLTRFYAKWAPEKLPKVEQHLEKYKGQEDIFFEALVQRYGPEDPPPSAAPAAAAPAAPAAAPSTTGAPPPATTAPPPIAAPGTPGVASGLAGGFSQMSQPAPGPDAGPYGHLTDDEMLGPGPVGYSFAGAGNLTPSASVVAPALSQAEQELQEIRRMVQEDGGFLCKEHQRRWEEAHLGRIPMATLKRDSEPLIEGFGQKYTVNKSLFVKNWLRRYFIASTPFLYYFETDAGEAACHGAVYLPKAEVREVDVEGRIVIEIESAARRKPLPVKAGGLRGSIVGALSKPEPGAEDGTIFQLYFDSTKAQNTWFNVLQRLSKITAVEPRQEEPRGIGATPVMSRAGSMYPGARRSVMVQPPGDGPQPPSPRPTTPPTTQLGGPPGQVPQAPPLSQLSQQQSQLMSPMLNPTVSFHGSPREAAHPHYAQPQMVHPHHMGAQPQGDLPISAAEITARIQRLSKERDQEAVIDALLHFIGRKVGSSVDLWRLMEAVEVAPPKRSALSQLAAADSVEGTPATAAEAQMQLAATLSAAPMRTKPLDEAANTLLAITADAGEPVPIPEPGTVPAEQEVRQLREAHAALERRSQQQFEALVAVQSKLTTAALQLPGGPSPFHQGLPPGMSPDRDGHFGHSGHGSPMHMPPGDVAPPPGGFVEGAAVQARMDRMRQRKAMLHAMINDLPR